MATTATKSRRRRRGTSLAAEPGPRRIAIYTRRSTDDEHQPFSIEAQVKALKNYINSQPNWTLVVEFSDDASGATTDRPDLQRALRAAHAGRFDVLLVVRVDRFSRRLSDLLSLLRELDEAGVAFVSATEPFDTSDPVARSFQDHNVRPRIVNGLVMLRQAHRVASVMSVRPAMRNAPMARLRRLAMTRGPERVRVVELSSW